VSTNDSTNTTNVTSFDKPDNKQNNKPNQIHSDLSLITETWPELPDAIRSAIVAIVRAFLEEDTDDD
jgi:hypothetical protein